MMLSGRVVFPGWWALVPTLDRAGDRRGQRKLPTAAAVAGAGRLRRPDQLSAYLWHWPLLFVLQITEGGAPSVRLKLGAVAVSFVLATLTFLLVERPIRRRLSIRTPRAIAALAAILLAVGAVSFYSQWSGRFMPRAPYLIAGIYSAVPSPRTDAACRVRFPTHGEYCQQYDAALPVATALLGNSHAEHFLEGVGAYLSAKGENVVHLGQSGCARSSISSDSSTTRTTRASRPITP